MADIDSPLSRLIGTHGTSWDADTGVATLHFDPPASFASPRGLVQGGLIGGFLDEVMGAAVLHASGGTKLPLNLDVNISFISGVPIAPLVGKGRIVKMGRNVAFMEGELFDADGKLLARSTSTGMLTDIPAGSAP